MSKVYNCEKNADLLKELNNDAKFREEYVNFIQANTIITLIMDNRKYFFDRYPKPFIKAVVGLCIIQRGSGVYFLRKEEINQDGFVEFLDVCNIDEDSYMEYLEHFEEELKNVTLKIRNAED